MGPHENHSTYTKLKPNFMPKLSRKELLLIETALEEHIIGLKIARSYAYNRMNSINYKDKKVYAKMTRKINAATKLLAKISSL